MPQVSRITDTWVGICCCHSSPTCIPMGGWIVTASHNAGSEGLNQGRMLDMVIGYCGHPGYVITSSGINSTNSLGKAYVGSMVTGCTLGRVITGSSTHTTGL